MQHARIATTRTLGSAHCKWSAPAGYVDAQCGNNVSCELFILIIVKTTTRTKTTIIIILVCAVLHGSTRTVVTQQSNIPLQLYECCDDGVT